MTLQSNHFMKGEKARLEQSKRMKKYWQEVRDGKIRLSGSSEGGWDEDSEEDPIVAGARHRQKLTVRNDCYMAVHRLQNRLEEIWGFTPTVNQVLLYAIRQTEKKSAAMWRNGKRKAPPVAGSAGSAKRGRPLGSKNKQSKPPKADRLTPQQAEEHVAAPNAPKVPDQSRRSQKPNLPLAAPASEIREAQQETDEIRLLDL